MPVAAFGPRRPVAAFGPRRPVAAFGPRRPVAAFGPRRPASPAVLVTGCSSGIGEAIARRLARGPHHVYATARDPASLAGLAAAGCRTLALDVTDEESVRSAVTAVEEAEGAVGVLVNNAGFSRSGPVETVPMDDARRQFETNLFGAARLIQLCLPGMRRQGWGRIVNVGTIGRRLVFPGGGWYHASKHALESLSDALRFEVAGFGVDVVVVEPGFIRTRFSEAAVASLDAEDPVYGGLVAQVAASTVGVYRRGRLAGLGGTADDVARVVERAVTAARPRARYPVTPSARLLIAARAAMPDRAWDALLRRTFPQPGQTEPGASPPVPD